MVTLQASPSIANPIAKDNPANNPTISAKQPTESAANPPLQSRLLVALGLALIIAVIWFTLRYFAHAKVAGKSSCMKTPDPS